MFLCVLLVFPAKNKVSGGGGSTQKLQPREPWLCFGRGARGHMPARVSRRSSLACFGFENKQKTRKNSHGSRGQGFGGSWPAPGNPDSTGKQTKHEEQWKTRAGEPRSTPTSPCVVPLSRFPLFCLVLQLKQAIRRPAGPPRDWRANISMAPANAGATGDEATAAGTGRGRANALSGWVGHTSPGPRFVSKIRGKHERTSG